jgi:hypothetical protein
VIVVKTVGARLERAGRARTRSRGRPTPAEPAEEPEAVTVTRVTVIRGTALEDTDTAREWLAGCRDAEAADGEVANALALLNRAVHAHRVSAGDPYAVDVSRGRARSVRLGYGSGEELVDGRWREAHTVPPPAVRGGRRRMLAPEEQVAGILGGRRPTHPSEDLLLRARLDLDHGRGRTAALQARAAHVALAAELAADDAGAKSRAAIEAGAAELVELANTALDRELSGDELDRLDEIVREMERGARRRRHRMDG